LNFNKGCRHPEAPVVTTHRVVTAGLEGCMFGAPSSFILRGARKTRALLRMT
jgi:hypothetical protein